MKSKSLLLAVVATTALVAAFQNCGQATRFDGVAVGATSINSTSSTGSAGGAGSASGQQPSNSSSDSSGTTGSTPPNPPPLPVVVTPSQPTICDPLSGTAPAANCATSGQGLIGNLYYLAASQYSQYGNLFANYVQLGTKAPVTIVISNLNIPDHSFTQGFSAPGGTPLTDDNGNLLIQYFGLDLYGYFTLTSDYSSGYYQFETNSDDGSNLFLDGTQIVSNDGSHSMEAAYSGYIQLTVGAVHTLHLQYFQGPPTMIGLQVYFRACESSTACSSSWVILPPEMLTH